MQLQVFAQPLQGHFFGEIGNQLDAFEVSGKCAVELIVVLLVFHQRRAAQVVEVVDFVALHFFTVRWFRCIGANHAFLQGFEQREELFDRDRQFGASQRVKKIEQHSDVCLAGLGQAVQQLRFHFGPLATAQAVHHSVTNSAVAAQGVAAQHPVFAGAQAFNGGL